MHFEQYPVISEFTQAMFDHIRSLPLIGTLFLMVVFDLVTGIAASCVTKTISSSVSFTGITRKIVMLLMVSFGSVLEPFCQGIPVARLISLGYIATETFSIVENAAIIGVPLPKEVVAAFVKIREYRERKSKVTIASGLPSPLIETHVHTTGDVKIDRTESLRS